LELRAGSSVASGSGRVLAAYREGSFHYLLIAPTEFDDDTGDSVTDKFHAEGVLFSLARPTSRRQPRTKGVLVIRCDDRGQRCQTAMRRYRVPWPVVPAEPRTETEPLVRG